MFSCRRQLAFVIIWISCGWLTAANFAPAQSDSDLSRLAQGLRSRQLFDLAESHCLTGLKSKELNPTEQCNLVLELIKTQTARAAVSSGSTRATNWRIATETAEAFIANNPNHPRRLLVEVQQALTHLTHGRLLRQELAADMAPANARESALGELRKANSILEVVQRKIEKEIPRQRGRTVGPHELSADQLITLNNNVRLQSAITGINRAQLYPADDKLNRVDALTVGMERLNEVRRESNSDEPIWWQTELQRVKCNRLLGRYSAAAKILSDLPIEEADNDTRQNVAVEQIRLAIEEQNMPAAKQLLALFLEFKNRSAEFDLALVDLMMELSKTEEGDFRTMASQLMVAIENRHGSYWGRRAEMLVIGDSGSTNANNGTTSNSVSATELDLLIRIGDQAVRKGRLEAALKAYANAVNQAEALKNWQFVFSATVRRSQVLEKQKRNYEAFESLVQVSNKIVDHEHAAAAHLRGCWNLSQSINSNPESAVQRKAELVKSLDEHLGQWPNSSTANQARLWSGRQLQSQRQWQLATERYLAITRDSPFFADAIKQSLVCMLAWVRESPSEQAATRVFADRLKQFATDPTLTDDGRAELMLARARFDFRLGPNESGTLAQEIVNVLESTSDEYRVELSSVLVVALADSKTAPKSAPTIEEVLITIKNDEPALRQAINGINALIRRRTGPIADQLLNTKLQLAELAMQLELEEAKKIHWMGEWADSLQRLGRNEEAVNALTELAEKQPKSAAVQIQLCRALSQVEGQQSAENALKSWRRLVRRLKPKSEKWFEAKYNIALFLHKTGKSDDALKLLEYLKAIPPGWSKSNWKREFDQLLIKCQNE